MSSLLKNSAGVLLSLALMLSPGVAQADDDDDSTSAATKDAQSQVQKDKDELSAEQDQLQHYQEQAKFYDDFAAKRLEHNTVLRKQVEQRLQAMQVAQKKKENAGNKHIAQEIEHLQAWLNDEAAKRKQIDQMRERWRTAVEMQTVKIQNTKYQTDVDKASLNRQQNIDKTNAAIQAENPKPKAAPVQGAPNVLVPGFEEYQGTIPVLLGPGG
ncbi:MAG: hypothetical protein K2X77_03125 [Candidatus Obscuribacterales bacterium]|nr:hypothetical protein [Candidatus Obscuribacterales bacterium]